MRPSIEAQDGFEERKQAACLDFNTRLISVDVFRARLYSLGYRGAEIETEVNLNWPKT